jgi:hypothetical protein
MAKQKSYATQAALPTMKKFSIKAGLLAAVVLPFGAILPANAAPTACSVYTVAQLTTSGFNCFIGDKVFSDFTFSGLSTGFYGFSEFGASTTFSGAALNFTGSSFTYGYKVALYNPIPGQAFLSYNTNAGGSAVSGGALAYSKSLSTTSPVSGPSTATETTVAPIVTFSPVTTGPVTFTSTLTRTSGKVDTLSDTLNQAKDPSINDVPGPLPLLGAGAAFGFSRRLRSRIKQVA